MAVALVQRLVAVKVGMMEMMTAELKVEKSAGQ
jgi:hypothetical protein